MRTNQGVWSPDGWTGLLPAETPPDLVLVFGGRAALQSGAPLAALSHLYPPERIFGCSTAGEISGTHVHDGSVVATAVWLERSRVVSARASLPEAGNAFRIGRLLGQRLTSAPRLKHVFVLSDGLHLNGSELVRGLLGTLPPGVSLSGGLSGDGADMKATVVCHRGALHDGLVSAVGFCGPVEVGLGSLGGWDGFGPQRQVTKAHGNVLYELDGEPALSLYKRYLGPHAAGLPGSGMLFPLRVQLPGEELAVARTVLGVDEAHGTMTFAGDIPVGATAQLTRANVERLVGGAAGAASAAARGAAGQPLAELALLVSCVGRKVVLKQRVEEEVEAVAEVLGPGATLTGFYSYGELAPDGAGGRCRLHNQTMTVTTLSEA